LFYAAYWVRLGKSKRNGGEMKHYVCIFILLSVVSNLCAQKTLLSKLKNFTLTVPKGMEQVNNINQMHIQAADFDKLLFITALSTPKSFLINDPITLADYHKENISEMMTNKHVKKLDTNIKIKLNGFPAWVSEFKAQFVDQGEVIKLSYLVYNFETEASFYYILSWTISKNYKANKKTVESVVNSFKETKK
jgi:hypothetical protein